MKGAPHACNGCGIAKREVNNWIIIVLHDDGRITGYKCWREKLAVRGHDDPRIITLCGDVCVHKAIGKWLDDRVERMEGWRDDATGQGHS